MKESFCMQNIGQRVKIVQDDVKETLDFHDSIP
jgi:hypothetical protein